ncbi:uncharacterized protein LOC105686433 isoform X3 [Athalia rosae]|uniref:uncharacterized protein LOC105686433 isoform X3 n=1 Tax=Athalia rosae TaxID=37344 RepID=UPI002034643C|nr:uncharacterized protein LOC105686433 isoform X3 [Athalia rosae]XP_048510384.1 uncharacterized protein LOC105686433 isoform X3 [Athalia rosae]
MKDCFRVATVAVAAIRHLLHNEAPRNNCRKNLDPHTEARIEQAKRSQRNSEYKKLPSSGGGNSGSGTSTGLISIQRLPIPHKGKEHHPLVEYWQSESESEDEMTLYPLSRLKESNKHKQDLTDTFSIEELSEGSEDSLHLGPAQSSHPHARTYTPVGCFTCHCHIL